MSQPKNIFCTVSVLQIYRKSPEIPVGYTFHAFKLLDTIGELFIDLPSRVVSAATQWDLDTVIGPRVVVEEIKPSTSSKIIFIERERISPGGRGVLPGEFYGVLSTDSIHFCRHKFYVSSETIIYERILIK